MRVLFIALFVLLFVSGCEDERKKARVTASLGADGYALFEVEGGTSERIAILVEMRDAAPGTYVLLHTREAPRSVGWFELDTDAFEACRKYGREKVDGPELDCLVPNAHGELVDMVTIGSDSILMPRPGETMQRKEASETTVMRHALGELRVPSDKSQSKRAVVGYYAVMRVEGGSGGAFSIEVLPFGEDVDGEPTIEQL